MQPRSPVSTREDGNGVPPTNRCGIGTPGNALSRPLATSVLPRHRRFLAKSAVTLLIAVLVGGVGPTSVPSPRDSAFPPQLLRRFNEWEQTLAQGGPAAVAAALSAANQAEMCVGHFWIAIRTHTALFPVLVADLSSPVDDRRLSVVSALEAIPPNQLKPHLGAIRSAAAVESMPGLRRLLGNLSTAVERS